MDYEVADAKKKIIEYLEENKIGTPKKNYKLKRLGILKTALLGRADPDRKVRKVWICSVIRG